MAEVLFGIDEPLCGVTMADQHKGASQALACLEFKDATSATAAKDTSEDVLMSAP